MHLKQEQAVTKAPWLKNTVIKEKKNYLKANYFQIQLRNDCQLRKYSPIVMVTQHILKEIKISRRKMCELTCTLRAMTRQVLTVLFDL